MGWQAYSKLTDMFSWKHFSWRKWLLLVVLLFVFTFLLAYLVGMTNETKQELFTAASLLRRLAIAVGLGLFLSFMDTESRK
ncbi:MAG: hypothetical protein JWQ78_2173 [Sediminibacterium sp.]|nr:hypothetical protein [Sediminibacterium sp.]